MLTREQKLERKNGIGGSDVAAIFGESPYNSAATIWDEKISPEVTEDEKDPAHYQNIGGLLEPAISGIYAQKYNVSVERPEKMFKHPKYDFMTANIDYLITNRNAALECKNVGQYSKIGNVDENNFPIPYLLQCAHYRIVLDLDYIDIAYLIGGNQFKCLRYVKNLELEQQIIEKEHIFWEHVKTKKHPPLMELEDLKLKEINAGAIIEGSAFAKERVEELSLIKAQLKELKIQHDNLNLLLAQELNENSSMVDSC